MRPLVALLAALALARGSAAVDDNCVWRVTLRAVPEGPLEEDLWHPSASVEVGGEEWCPPRGAPGCPG